ncbi:hypothetical protein LCGC14_1593430 [marine sediment metagenome]|uniref:Uncharacterized protein n=1 Tax=marine sediment metagenome TaxID=412755 RepID=A0A0F9IZP2_9ZZZZ
MAWTTRLRNGLVKMLAPENRYDHLAPSGPAPNNSLDVNSMRMSFEEAIMSGSPPGLSQPVWGPEISTVGRYSREGYTSKTFDRPLISFSAQALPLANDEDVTLALNHLASQVTGGEHFWKGQNDQITEYIENFSQAIDFDELDTIIVKELLWFGNSFWKPRMGVGAIRSKHDIMHIPISSAVRIWWDRQRIPYKYEFRGAEYQGYHNPDEIIHLKWNPINASAFGVGFGIAMTTSHSFEQITANGAETNVVPSLLDRKYSNQLTMHVTERRYTPRNVWIAPDADEEERAILTAKIQDLKLAEDVVAGSQVEIKELGSSSRAFNPTQFTDTVLGPIMKALQDFRGKQGTESSHQFANAKTSAVLDEIGLSSFPLAVTRMLIEQLFRPWYDLNPIYDPSYGGGIVAIPWDDCEYELHFGRVAKQDIDLPDQIKLIKLAIQTGAVQDPVEIRDLLEDAGLGLRKEYGEQMQNEYQDYNAVPPDFEQPMEEPLATDSQFGGGPVNFSNQGMGLPPNDMPIFNDMIQDVRGDNPATDIPHGRYPFVPEPYDGQPSDPRLNFTETKRRLFDRKTLYKR